MREHQRRLLRVDSAIKVPVKHEINPLNKGIDHRYAMGSVRKKNILVRDKTALVFSDNVEYI